MLKKNLVYTVLCSAVAIAAVLFSGCGEKTQKKTLPYEKRTGKGSE